MHCGTSSQTREGCGEDTRFMSHRDERRRSSNGLGSMRYFTPELVLQLNSSDSDIVDDASERWEDAILSYQSHLRKLRREMPERLQPLTQLSLHDWSVVT